MKIYNTHIEEQRNDNQMGYKWTKKKKPKHILKFKFHIFLEVLFTCIVYDTR